MTKQQSSITDEKLSKRDIKGERSAESPRDSKSPGWNSRKSFWLRLTDPQAAVLAAIIAAAVSLVAAGISVWGTSYKFGLQREGERSAKTLRAYEEAIKAIRHMKSQIQVVIDDKEITIENARNDLRAASAELDKAYEDNASVLIASDYYLAKEIFHGTKSSGRRAWNNLNQEGNPKLTAAHHTSLESILNELSSAEEKLQEKYNSLAIK